MITPVGTVTLGVGLTATASATAALTALADATSTATAAIDLLAGISGPELTAKLGGYMSLLIPSPSFDISAQIVVATSALASATAEVAGIPVVGVGLAAALTAAVAAQQAAQLAIKGADLGIALKVDAALASLASLNVQLSAGITGPNVNLVLIADVIAELTAQLAVIQAQIALAVEVAATAEAKLAIAAGIDASLGVSGLKLYRFDGDISVAGAELQARITTDGLTGAFNFMIMLPTSPATWGALQATVKTS